MARELVKTISRGKRNLVQNSHMGIYQRESLNGGGNITGTGATQFVADRWGSWFPSGGSYTSPSIYHSSLPASFPGKPWIDRANRLVASTVDAVGSFNTRQRIESGLLNADEIDTISVGFYGWASIMQDCTIQIIQPDTGTPDDWASFFIVDQVTLSVDDSAWKFYEFENVSLDNRDGLEIRIIFSNPSSTVTTADTYVTQVMCNEGETLEEYRLHSPTAEAELEECQRFFLEGQARIGSVVPPNGQLRGGFVGFPVTMRAIPTMTFRSESLTFGQLTYRWNTGNATTTSNVPSGSNITRQGFSHSANAGFATGTTVFFSGGYFADAEL